MKLEKETMTIFLTNELRHNDETAVFMTVSDNDQKIDNDQKKRC